MKTESLGYLNPPLLQAAKRYSTVQNRLCLLQSWNIYLLTFEIFTLKNHFRTDSTQNLKKVLNWTQKNVEIKSLNLFWTFELPKFEPQNFTKLNAKKCWEKTPEIESLTFELNAKNSSKNKNSVPIHCTAPQHAFGVSAVFGFFGCLIFCRKFCLYL